ncbi:MAG: response regulator [Candidatus Riflebacteria bacterium]|nr:response regulator [Candidatus Riflebacteria bacterium]
MQFIKPDSLMFLSGFFLAQSAFFSLSSLPEKFSRVSCFLIFIVSSLLAINSWLFMYGASSGVLNIIWWVAFIAFLELIRRRYIETGTFKSELLLLFSTITIFFSEIVFSETPGIILRVIATVVIFVTIWRKHVFPDYSSVQKQVFKKHSIIVLLIMISLAAFLMPWTSQKKYDSVKRREQLGKAISIAASIDPEYVSRLDFTSADKTNPAFKIIRERMVAFGHFIHQRSIYSMKLMGGRVFFGPENLDESDPMASPPGTEYREIPPEDLKAFKDGKPAVFGPVKDEYGTFITAVAPILDPLTEKVMVLIGLDIPIDDWNREIAEVRLFPLLYLLVFSLVLQTGINLFLWRNNSFFVEKAHYQHFALILTLLTGVLVSILAGFYADSNNKEILKEKLEDFSSKYYQMLRSEVISLRDDFFYAAKKLSEKETFTSEDFKYFVEHFAARKIVKSVEVLKYLKKSDRSAYEELMRNSGNPDFTIYDTDNSEPQQTDNSGNFLVVSNSLNSLSSKNRNGLNLMADLSMRDLFNSDERKNYLSGNFMMTLVDEIMPLSLSERNVQNILESGIVLIKKITESPSFLSCTISLDGLLKSVLSKNSIDDSSISFELVDLASNGEVISLAVYPDNGVSWVSKQFENVENGSSEMVSVFPFFHLNHTMALIAFPGENFYKSPALMSPLGIIFSGLLLTIILLVFFHLNYHRCFNEFISEIETLKMILNAMPDPILIQSLNQRTVFTNTAGNIFMQKEPLIEMSDRCFKEALHLIISERKDIVEFDEDLEKMSLHFEFRGLPVYDNKGRLSLVISLIRDITSRFRTDEALRHSMQKYKLLFTEMMNGFALHEIITDKDGKPCDYRFLEVNPAFEKLTNLKAEKLLGKTVLEVFPKTEKYWIENYGSVALKGESAYFEQYSGTLDKTFEVRAFCPRKGEFACIVDDVTMRKHAEHNLAKRVHLQKVLMEVASEFINCPIERIVEVIQIALLRVGKFVGVDRAKVYDYDFSDNLARNTYEWRGDGSSWRKSQNIPIDILSEVLSCHQKGKTWYFADDRESPVSEQLKDYFRKNNIKSIITLPKVYLESCYGFISFETDSYIKIWEDYEIDFLKILAEIIINVEKRRQYEDSLIQARQLAESATRAKNLFLANVSHEIRTPMNGVIGMTSILADTPLTTKQREFLDIVKSSSEHLLTLLNDILDVSKIEAEKITLEAIDFDLRVCVEDTLDAFALKADEKGLELICNFDLPFDTRVRGDPGRLRQILINLLGNAIKFTSSGEVSLRASKTFEIEEKATFRFEIRDTGIGIPSETEYDLFEPFTQVDSSTTRKFGGTGLGLCISKKLCKLMSGEIGYESIPEEGSMFWFTVVLDKQPATVVENKYVRPSLKDKKFLIVDDNDTCRKVFYNYLISWGCRCELANDGFQAMVMLEKAADESDPFDVVLLDYQMPGMDGMETGASIKKNQKLSSAQLIVLTSQAQRGDGDRFQKAGFSGYLGKPVRKLELRDCIEIVLSDSLSGKKDSERKLVTTHLISEEKKLNSNILIAEDNITNQKVALAIMEKIGYRADIVESGAEALQALEKKSYDLVLMDCQMPEMDGYEATRAIRSGKYEVKDPAIVVIAMTANALEGDREKCLECGMNDYISKPLFPKQLLAIIKKWLKG